jgi:hypothetical protein
MEQIANLLLVIIFSGLTLTALLSTVALLAPGPVERSRLAVQISPWRAFWLGLANLVFFLALVLLLIQIAKAVIPPVASVLGLLALVILGGLLLLVLLGLTGLAAHLRERLGGNSSPLAGHMRASALLLLAALTPVVGWWVFAPVVVIIALGAGLLAVVTFRRTAPAPAAPAER